MACAAYMINTDCHVWCLLELIVAGSNTEEKTSETENKDSNLVGPAVISAFLSQDISQVIHLRMPLLVFVSLITNRAYIHR